MLNTMRPPCSLSGTTPLSVCVQVGPSHFCHPRRS